ncbi:MAG: transposase family protein [Culicoidibacterales bacterium]
MKDDLLQNLFPTNFNIDGYELEKNENKLTVFLSCIIKESICPCCRQKSKRIHSYHVRTIQDLPIGEYGVTLKIPFRRFQCLNLECKKNYFVETFPSFVSSKKRRTDRLTASILRLALHQASEECARELEYNHIKISGDTILKIIKEKSIDIDYQEVTKIAIDDFAFKKKDDMGL